MGVHVDTLQGLILLLFVIKAEVSVPRRRRRLIGRMNFI
jgi:hypothetical protein